MSSVQTWVSTLTLNHCVPPSISPHPAAMAMPALRSQKSVARFKVDDKDTTPNGGPMAITCIISGAFLTGCGYYGAMLHNFEQKAMHSLYMGALCGGVLAVMGLLAISGKRMLYMIGVHLGLLLQLLFTGVFALQSYRSYGVPAKADRFPLFVVMGGGSALALGLMRVFKPKKNKTK